MCAIFGIALLNGHKIRDEKKLQIFINNLFIENKRRGADSSGIAITSAKETCVLKDKVDGSTFIETNSYKKLIDKYIKLSEDMPMADRPLSIIGHCRSQTQGTFHNNNNNHPIISGNIVGVHNGMISNDKQLFTTFGNKLSQKGEVDSEVIFSMLNFIINDSEKETIQAIKFVSETIQGSYACAFVNTNTPQNLWLFRADNPCELLHYKKTGVLVFGSIKWYLDDALKTSGLDLGIAEEIKIPSHSGIGINVNQNDICKFYLKNKTAQIVH